MMFRDGVLVAQRRIALLKPCYIAEDCVNAAYAFRTADGDISVILTVNSGYE